MAQQTSGHSIEDIYKAVIADVISQVKEAFLDENIDVDVLHQLKKEWEDKVNASGAVDMEGSRNMRTPPASRSDNSWANGSQRSSVPSVMYQSQGSTEAAPIDRAGQNQPVQQAQIVNVSLPSLPHQGEGNMPQQPMLQQIIRVQGGQNVVRVAQVQGVEAPARRAAPGGQQFIVVSQQGQPLTSQNIQRMQQSSVFPSQGGQVSGAARQAQALLPQASYTFPEGPSQAGGAPRMASANILPFYFSNQPGTKPVYLPADSLGRPLHSAMNSLAAQYLNAPGTSQRIDPPVHQLDGAAELSGEEDDSAEPTEIVIEAKNVITKKLSKRQMRKLTEKMSHMLVAQVDGGGGGMTDSSSEDDEEEEDPLQKFVNKIDEGNGEEGEEGLREEQPLNSDDDQSDDEDLETLFDADNVVMCQFEKVHRARQKWKFHLKDGVMQIQGRDYVFSKCVGEAEW